MLEWLKLQNVGPAPEFELSFGSRVNLITGDNGLGKSFLLDVAWWALTGVWSNGVIIPNSKEQQTPVIEWSSSGFSFREQKRLAFQQNQVAFDFKNQKWQSTSTIYRELDFLILQSKVDGAFSIYDSHRTVPFGHGDFLFDVKAVWDGLQKNEKVVCNGLIRDWGVWQLENGESFQQLKSALKVISPDQNEILEPGKLTRVSLEDARDIPTLKMPYGQEVPVTQASAGIRRIASMVYLMIWAWQEHLRAAQLKRAKPTTQLIILIDELEEHLHPRWQRVFLPALLEVAKTIMSTSDVRVQIIAATHSPLVMASFEPMFDPTQDAWFDLNLVDGKVTLEKMPWRKRGDANAWLQSEAFDLNSTGSVQAAEVKDRAAKAIENARLSKKKFLELDHELRATLAETDPFLMRWQYWGEKKGWL